MTKPNRSPVPDTDAVAPNDGPAQCGDCDNISSPLPEFTINDARAVAEEYAKAGITTALRSYRPPIEEVCGCCGAKHYGPFVMCSRCQNALNRGE